VQLQTASLEPTSVGQARTGSQAALSALWHSIGWAAGAVITLLPCSVRGNSARAEAGKCLASAPVAVTCG